VQYNLVPGQSAVILRGWEGNLDLADADKVIQPIARFLRADCPGPESAPEPYSHDKWRLPLHLPFTSKV